VVVAGGGGPEEGSHSEGALVVDGAGDGQAVLGEEAVELPLGHGLVVLPTVPRVVQRHLEVVPAPAAGRLMLLQVPPLPAAGAVPRRLPDAAVRRHRLYVLGWSLLCDQRRGWLADWPGETEQAVVGFYSAVPLPCLLAARWTGNIPGYGRGSSRAG